MSVSWLHKLFGHTEQGPEDFRFLGADMHSHLLPGIDDGSANMDDSISMIKGLAKLGFSKLITTPHFMIDGFSNTAVIVAEKLNELKIKLKEENIDVQIDAAAEYFLDEGFLNAIDNNDLLSFGEDKYVLFELSYVNEPRNLNEVIFNLCSRGYKPVLAHAERYAYLHSDSLNAYQEIKDTGALLQMNILSIAALYKSENKHISESLLKKGLIDFMATDLHNIRQLELLSNTLNSKYLKLAMNNNTLLNKKLL